MNKPKRALASALCVALVLPSASHAALLRGAAPQAVRAPSGVVAVPAGIGFAAPAGIRVAPIDLGLPSAPAVLTQAAVTMPVVVPVMAAAPVAAVPARASLESLSTQLQETQAAAAQRPELSDARLRAFFDSGSSATAATPVPVRGRPSVRIGLTASLVAATAALPSLAAAVGSTVEKAGAAQQSAPWGWIIAVGVAVVAVVASFLLRARAKARTDGPIVIRRPAQPVSKPSSRTEAAKPGRPSAPGAPRVPIQSAPTGANIYEQDPFERAIAQAKERMARQKEDFRQVAAEINKQLEQTPGMRLGVDRYFQSIWELPLAQQPSWWTSEPIEAWSSLKAWRDDLMRNEDVRAARFDYENLAAYTLVLYVEGHVGDHRQFLEQFVRGRFPQLASYPLRIHEVKPMYER